MPAVTGLCQAALTTAAFPSYRRLMMKRALSPLFLFLLAMPAWALTSRDVRVVNGDVVLRGTLTLPDGVRPAPAVIFLHGSGPQTRQGVEFIADAFARKGFATLTFDKRGCGESSGSWIEASLQDLASDAVAVVRYAAQQPEIDKARIGLWSVSQSGWYAPIAANSEPAVSFLIVVTGGGATPREVEWFGYEGALRHRGASESDVTAARGLVARYFDYLATGEKRGELLDAIAAAKKEAWSAAVPLERVLPSEGNRERWSWVATYDPRSDIAKLHVPVLLLFGGADHLTPPVSLDRWTAALARARVTVRVFPEAGHAIVAGEHAAPVAGKRPNYAVGYLEMMSAWLSAVTAN